MHKAHFMSQTNVTLPFIVEDLCAVPVGVEPTSRRAFQRNPATAKFRFADGNATQKGKPIDSWQLRERFLSWPLEDWQRFFEISGKWQVGSIGDSFSRDDFAEWQRLLRAALVCQAKGWSTLYREFHAPKVVWLHFALAIHFEWDGKVPSARIRSPDALQSMIASIQIDKLQGAAFRMCARPDCTSVPFRLGARNKIFCSTDCAHLVAVRESRKRARERVEKEGK
jgi:hypothetical protein